MWKAVLSRAFSSKLRGFTPARQADVRKAIDRVLVNPRNVKYQRPYLDPYCEEHPSDKTLTIYFIMPRKAGNCVFFVWVNDDTCPHNTFKNYSDPCLKEFTRLRDNKELEEYDQDNHEGKFTVKPRPQAPAFMKFEKYGASVHANVLDDGFAHYIMGIASPSNPANLFDHYKLFIEKIREHFSIQRKPFEFRVWAGNTQFEKLLNENIDPANWHQTSANGEIIFQPK